MRIVVVLFLALLVPAAAAETLFFVGDGDNVSLAESKEGVSRTWPMALEGHGATATTYEMSGSANEGSFQSSSLPTFVYPGVVEISADMPVDVYVYVNDSNQLGCNDLDGQLFDGSGKALGPANFRSGISGSDKVVEVKFSFKDIAGTFTGLVFQAAGPWADCSLMPYTFHWGSDAAPARIEFAVPAAEVAGGEAHTANLTDGLNFTFDNATSDSFVFNASASPLMVNIDFEAGAANVTFNGTSTVHNATAAFLLPAGAPLNITFDAFVGTLTFTAPDLPDTNHTMDAATPDEHAVGNETADGNETLDGTTPASGKESPGAPLALLLVAVGLLAARRR